MKISVKITLIYAAILALTLFIISAITGAGVYFGFYHQAEVELQISMENVLREVEKGNLFNQNFFERDPLLPGVVMRVTDETGRVILDTDAHYPSIGKIRRSVRKNRAFMASPNFMVAELRNFIIYYTKIELTTDRTYTLHFFKTVTSERNFLRTLLWVLFITNVIGFLIALFAGFFISGRILKPITTFTKLLQSVEISRLKKRIPVISRRPDELTEMAETFNLMMDRLEDGFKRQQQFVSDASHELRTPVTVILGYADLLDRWGKSDPKTLDEAVSAIKSEAKGMQALIEKLLFLARADQKRQAVKKENLDVGEILKDVIKKFEVMSKHEVVLERCDSYNAMTDPVLFREMIRIFLENSEKYTEADKKIGAKFVVSENAAIMTLFDEGIGIKKDEQEKIFERFYRVNEERGKKTGGTGLGLSIAKWIAEVHNISIEIDSEEGRGTKIILRFEGSESSG